MREDTLALSGGGPGLRALLSRAVGIDATASVRLRNLPAPYDGVDVFVTTPFDVVAARRVSGRVSRDGAVALARTLFDALSVADAPQITIGLGVPRDPLWPGALPPAEGFQLVDTLPVEVVRDLSEQGQRLARQFSGPLGPPASLLSQPVVELESGGVKVSIPMRMIFACTSLSLIPGFAAPLDIPRHLRVSSCASWVRVDAPFGSVYHSERLSIF